MLSVLKASQAISGKLPLETLLETVMHSIIEHAEAQRGVLLLKRAEHWTIEAETTHGTGDSQHIVQSIPISLQDEQRHAILPIPVTVINYVRQTRQYLVLDNPTTDRVFWSDGYIVSQQPQSILCLPLIYQNNLTGIFYLEHSLTNQAFVEERITMVQLLCNQIALAIEHTSLCNRMEDIVSERTAEIMCTNKSLETEIAEQKRTELALRESEQTYRKMFEKNQAIKLLIDPQIGAIIDANPAACAFYGYSHDVIQTKKIMDINLLPPAEVKEEMRRAKSEQRSFFLFRHRLASGETRHVEVHSSPIEIGGRTLLYSIIHDITDRVQAETELQRQDAILESVGTAAQNFLKSSNVQHEFPLFLELVGIATGVSRVVLFTVETGVEGQPVIQPRESWIAAGQKPLFALVKQNITFSQSVTGNSLNERNFPRWSMHLCQGLPIYGNVSALPRDEQRVLEQQHIRSLAVIPIFVEHSWWGFIEFDVCQTERTWSLAEIRALEIAANIMSGALEREHVQRVLRENEERFRTVADFTYDWEYWTGPAGNYMYISPSCERITGYTPEAFQVDPDLLSSIIHPDDRHKSLCITEIPPSEQEHLDICSSEFRIRTRIGEERWIGHISLPVYASDGRWLGRRASNRDITERVRVEEELRQSHIVLEQRVAQRTAALQQTEYIVRRVNRALKTLSACNQVLIRETDETALLYAICTVIVDIGGYRMTWVGYALDDDQKRIVPVAQAGYENGYLDSVKLTWADAERGQGPGGTAIRTRKYALARYIQTDPTFLPWREDAIQRGYESVIALPLITGEYVDSSIPIGALMIYANEPDAFDTAEIDLLTELADDLAYGIVMLRIRNEHRQTASRLTHILNIAASAIIAVDANQSIQIFNPAAELIFGYQNNEVVGKPFDMLLSPASKTAYEEYLCEVMTMTHAQMSGSYLDVQARRRYGTTFPAEVSVATSHQDDEILCTIIIQDITAQKQAEEELIASRDRISDILESITDAFFTLDRSFRFGYVNRQAEKLLRKTREEMWDQNVWELFPDAVGTRFDEEYHHAMEQRVSVMFETLYEPWSLWFEVHAYPSREGLSVYFREITERKHAEQELHRVNRALKTLSEGNKAIVRATDETTLLNDICTIIVQVGGYRMTWVGYADQDDEACRIRPVAQAGYEEGFLEGLNLTWTDAERGQGPTGAAVRTRQTCIVRDILTNADYEPWRKDAIKRGYRSSIALPLVPDSMVQSDMPAFGVLNIYAQEPDAFDAAEIELLTEMADDLAYGITALRIRDEHRQSEAQLHHAHQRLQTLSRRLVDIQESERRHIARELHDEVGQALTGLHLLLEMIGRMSATDQIMSRLDEACKVVNDLMSKVSEMSLTLRPAMLDDLGLLPTLRWHFNRYTIQTNIHVTFKHNGVDQRFDPELETVVYRLIQEALTNVARYAQVEEVTVRLWSDWHTLGMMIEDQGVGFDPQAAMERKTSSGLAGMYERVVLLNGHLEIESAPDMGTCLTAELPLRPDVLEILQSMV